MMNEFLEQAKQFEECQAYRQPPYNSRNWGGRWHSMCSYHGKLKPSIAHFLITNFTKPRETVLDPLCGVGTIPFEACRQGRIGIGNDLSRLAFCVTKAKIEPPSKQSVEKELQALALYIDNNYQTLDKSDLPYSGFGLNKPLQEYFEPSTFAEIILAREYFQNTFEAITSEQAFIMSCIMHILHGNRPYALSRKSHPLTPYAPQGPFEYKNLIEHTSNKVNLVFSTALDSDFTSGTALWGDYSEIDIKEVDTIITSPPFAGSMKFFTQNWMRLWFSGWEPEDFRNANNDFLDAKQLKHIEVYKEFFSKCYDLLKSKGRLIMHIGHNSKMDMADSLIPLAKQYFKLTYSFDEDVRAIEKHGLKDKGGTVEHQFLFLEKLS